MRFKRLFEDFSSVGLFFIFCNLVFAQSIQDEIADLKERIAKLESKLAKQEEEIGEQKVAQESLAKIKEAFGGLMVRAGATFIVQGAHNANADVLSWGGEDVTDASYSIDLEFEKEFSDYGKAYLHFESGNGKGVTDELKIFSNVNADATADENFDLIEAWYEHYFKSLPLTLTFGKIDATCYIDTNEYANDETTQFLGDIFKNSPTLEFPDDNGCGVRFSLEPADFLGIELVVMDADSDWEDTFDNIFFSGQINFKPNLFGKAGNYRIFGWLNDKEHTDWNDSNKAKEKGYGIGLSFDQELTDNLGAFLRYAWQNPKIYMNGEDFSLEHSWSTGLQVSGSFWGRDDDILSFAFGQVIPSGDYKKVNNLKARSEEHLELYYSLKINEHITLSPDIQLIWDPYGKDATNGDDIIFVGGLRTQVDF